MKHVATARRQDVRHAPSVLVAPLDAADLNISASLQVDELGLGLYPALGPGFLRAYHRTFIDSPYAVALAACRDDETVGILLGTLDSVRHRSWVARHRSARLVGRASVAMAARPHVAARFAHTRVRHYLRLLRKAVALPSPEHTPPISRPAVLSHLAVVPKCQGTGVGAALLLAFEDQARAAGNSHAVLLTRTGCDAERFYAAHGWASASHIASLDGVPLTHYAKAL